MRWRPPRRRAPSASSRWAGGRPCAWPTTCHTRVLEMTVHGLDLADALGVPPWTTPGAAEVTRDLLVGTARRDPPRGVGRPDVLRQGDGPGAAVGRGPRGVGHARPTGSRSSHDGGAARALRREVDGLPRVPPAGGVARAGGARAACARFADQDVLGPAGAGLRRPGRARPDPGLAPAAHGGNRTGRIFTGDRSGDFLFASLHPHRLREPGDQSVARDDGLRLADAYVTAVNRCAPPANKPTPEERDRCLPFLAREIAAARRACASSWRSARSRWDGALRALGAARPSRRGPSRVRPCAPRPRSAPFALLGCFHPSQQNTFTGKLTRR